MRVLKTDVYGVLVSIKYITDSYELTEVVNEILTNKISNRLVGIDTECTGLDCHISEVRLAQLAIADDVVYVIDRWKCDKDYTDRELKRLFDNDKVNTYSGQNLKYDIKMLWSIGIDLSLTKIWDTMLADQIIYAGYGLDFDLNSISKRHLKQYVDKTEQKSDWSVNELSTDQIVYAGIDAVKVRQLAVIQKRIIQRDALAEVLKLEFRTLFPTAAMEYYGVRVNVNKITNVLRPLYLGHLQDAESHILSYFPDRYIRKNLLGEIIDQGLDVGSPSQLLAALQGLGIPDPLEQAAIIQSTGKNVLGLLDLEDYPVIESILKFRGYSKLFSSYIESLPGKINTVTGKIHARFNQCGASTGRFCLAKGTKVTCVGGYKNIEDIKPGDLVYSLDDNNKPVIKRVLNQWYTGFKKCITLNWNYFDKSGSILCTPDHKIRTTGIAITGRNLEKEIVVNIWVEAQDLKAGDFVFHLTEDAVVLKAAVSSNISTNLNHSICFKDVYDIEVEGTHNFMADGICVHNSSSEPNLQQLPRVSGNPDETIRSCFIPSNGYKFAGADMSQIELRVIAEVIYQLTNDRLMLQEFIDGKDPYANTAALLSGMDYDKFMQLDKKEYKARRQRAKAVRLGFNYALGARKFKNYARINYGVAMTQKEAEETRESYFKAYPGLGKYHQMYQDKSIIEAYSLPPFNRRRRWFEHPGMSALVNMPIQSTSGDITKLAMANLYEELHRDGYSPTQSQDVRILLSVHDEVVGEAIEDKIDYANDKIESHLVKAGQLVLKYCPVAAEAKAMNTLAEKD